VPAPCALTAARARDSYESRDQTSRASHARCSAERRTATDKFCGARKVQRSLRSATPAEASRAGRRGLLVVDGLAVSDCYVTGQGRDPR